MVLSRPQESVKLALFVDGLDEFFIPPREVVVLFRAIKTRCSGGPKLCVASRPWTEFDNEFNESPMLDMHILTGDDMIAFISGSFQGHKGFGEQKRLFLNETGRLLRGIVDKANCVVLWASVVVQLLSDLLS
ncbi:hypothetical protein MFIFM68171_08562 [Madurella fahalii]|uniref:NACHT domain-containing protein n=1 Tax=Madurella fahalii TaxID=1157608 RepID=A0ABQ0GKQ4_9PEZI